MPGKSGTDLLSLVKTRYPTLPVLILSMHNEPNIALGAIKAGASGYITKDCDLNQARQADAAALTGIAQLVSKKFSLHISCEEF